MQQRVIIADANSEKTLNLKIFSDSPQGVWDIVK